MPRGGSRQGKPGANYGNRTDLALGPRKLPIQAAPGQTYGDATAQMQAQQQVPMATQALPTGPTPDPMQAAQQFQPPPTIPASAPSMRPDEPLTAGMGAPPPVQPSPLLNAVALLNSLGDNAPPEVKALRDSVNATQANEAAP